MPELQSPLDQQDSIFSVRNSGKAATYAMQYQPEGSQPNQPGGQTRQNRTQRRIFTQPPSQPSQSLSMAAEDECFPLTQAEPYSNIDLRLPAFPAHSQQTRSSSLDQGSSLQSDSQETENCRGAADPFSMHSLKDHLPAYPPRTSGHEPLKHKEAAVHEERQQVQHTRPQALRPIRNNAADTPTKLSFNAPVFVPSHSPARSQAPHSSMIPLRSQPARLPPQQGPRKQPAIRHHGMPILSRDESGNPPCLLTAGQ